MLLHDSTFSVYDNIRTFVDKDTLCTYKEIIAIDFLNMSFNI